MSVQWPVALCLLTGCLVQNLAFDPVEASGGAQSSMADATTVSPTTGEDSSSGSGSHGGSSCRVDADCSDGLFCTGAEVCDPASGLADLAGCVPGAEPCGPGEVCQERGAVCVAACELDQDADDDGVPGVACGGLDCDDNDPAIFPGQTEVCDAQGVDEDCDPGTLGGLDADADGLISDMCCNIGKGDLVCGPDCDDSLPGLGAGDWAHCAACGATCGAKQACEGGVCIEARRVFTTSTKYQGNIGGLAGADANCQARADAAALGGAFKAYLVDDNTGLDRLEHPNLHFVRLDGVKIADDWSDLSDASLDAPLAIDEFRQPALDNAWTGLRDVDGGGVSSCSNWTSSAGGCLNSQICGGAGETAMPNDHWDGFFIFNCSDGYRLYCIEQ